MAQGAATVSLTLVCKREIVVRVGVLRDERDGTLVSGDRVLQAL